MKKKPNLLSGLFLCVLLFSSLSSADPDKDSSTSGKSHSACDTRSKPARDQDGGVRSPELPENFQLRSPPLPRRCPDAPHMAPRRLSDAGELPAHLAMPAEPAPMVRAVQESLHQANASEQGQQSDGSAAAQMASAIYILAARPALGCNNEINCPSTPQDQE